MQYRIIYLLKKSCLTKCQTLREAERTMRKIKESEKSPMSPKDFADYMRRNLEIAKEMEAASK